MQLVAILPFGTVAAGREPAFGSLHEVQGPVAREEEYRRWAPLLAAEACVCSLRPYREADGIAAWETHAPHTEAVYDALPVLDASAPLGHRLLSRNRLSRFVEKALLNGGAFIEPVGTWPAGELEHLCGEMGADYAIAGWVRRMQHIVTQPTVKQERLQHPGGPVGRVVLQAVLLDRHGTEVKACVVRGDCEKGAARLPFGTTVRTYRSDAAVDELTWTPSEEERTRVAGAMRQAADRAVAGLLRGL